MSARYAHQATQMTRPVPRQHLRKTTALLLLLTSTAAWFAASQDRAADLQTDVERILTEEGLTGIGWAIVDKTGEPIIGSAGVRDASADLSFDVNTHFHVGSVTKALLATGVLRLASSGRIHLDSPVIQFLPNLFPEDPPPEFSRVTVRHLLDHTSGMSDASLWQIFSEQPEAATPLRAAFRDPAKQLEVRATPGARFSYSNMGYTLLGMIIEAVAKEPYESYLDKALLAPLKMDSSTFSFTTQVGERADPDLAWGHFDDGSRHAAVPMFLRPAGQFTTSSADLARFAEFLLGDGSIQGETFIDHALMRARGRPQDTGAAMAGLAAGYALGLGRRDRHGVVAFCHGGNTLGFVAMLCIFPKQQKAFAYSVNTDSETADYSRLDALFVEALNIAKPTAPQTTQIEPDLSQWYGSYVLSPNRFQMFEYLDTVFGSVRVSPTEDAVLLSSLQNDPRMLRSVGSYLYSAGDRTTASHVFFRDPEGRYLLGDGFVTYEKVQRGYLIAHWISLLAGIGGLVWFLLTGSTFLIRQRAKAFRQPAAPAFISSALLFAPVPLFFTQSFMAMGDLTPASMLLAVTTTLLPVGMLATLWLAVKERSRRPFRMLHSIAAVLVLQWCVVLAANGLLPLRLWA